jgi:hypothetical protein|tara:strand:+ start:88 stop:510 length:423 start_codon:yes stop_codon:yes gene_type:complete
MSKIDDKLNEILEVTAEQILAPAPVKKQEVAVIPESNDPQDDFEHGRANLYKLIEKGNEAVDGILSLAKESEHPRTYEVAGQLIQTVSQVSQDLLRLQQGLRRLKEVPDTGPKNVTNALYIGSTNELQKLLKKNNKDGKS